MKHRTHPLRRRTFEARIRFRHTLLFISSKAKRKLLAPDRRNVQRPRAFYRRELEASPLVVAKPLHK